MRKFSFLLLLFTLLFCFHAALAAPATPYDPATMLWYPQLTTSQQQLFDLLYFSIASGEETLDLPAQTQLTDLTAAMEVIHHDCPEFVHFSGEYTSYYYDHAPDIAASIAFTYSQPVSHMTQVVQFAAACASSVSGDAYTRALSLHDLLCAKCTYAFGDACYNAFGALLDGQAVCAGYANAYTLLLRMSGIQAGQVTGTADNSVFTGDHAWNLLVLPQGAMLVDVTWDDQESADRPSHDYFGLTDEMMAVDHFEEAFLPRPACTTLSLNYHYQTGAFFAAGQTEAQMQEWWQGWLARISNGLPEIDVRFESLSDYQLFLSEQFNWIDAYNKTAGNLALYGNFTYTQENPQQTFRLSFTN